MFGGQSASSCQRNAVVLRERRWPADNHLQGIPGHDRQGPIDERRYLEHNTLPNGQAAKLRKHWWDMVGSLSFSCCVFCPKHIWSKRCPSCPWLSPRTFSMIKFMRKTLWTSNFWLHRHDELDATCSAEPLSTATFMYAMANAGFTISVLGRTKYTSNMAPCRHCICTSCIESKADYS